MKVYLRHTRDEKVMNLVKISTNQHAIFTSDAFEMENACWRQPTRETQFRTCWLRNKT